LVIAACVVDDMIGLILLSVLQVFVKEDPAIFEYFIPLISSFGFMLVLGLPAVTFMPRLIQKSFLPLFPKKWKTLAMFGLLTAMCMAYLPLLKYTKSSYLTGAFLAGATFSQIDGAYDQFMHSGHDVIAWLLRVFFAASIGFQVPIKEFSLSVILNGCLLWVTCVTIKFLVAFYVPKFEKVEKDAIYNPYKRDLFVTGLAMTCRGEFSFLIAAFALSEGIIKPDIYASVVFAVLLSAITSPFMLLQCISYFKAKELEQQKQINSSTDSDGKIPLFMIITFQTKNAWSLLARIQDEVHELDLVIEDVRTKHTRGVDPVIHTDLYVRDEKNRIDIVTVAGEKVTELSKFRVGKRSSLIAAARRDSYSDLLCKPEASKDIADATIVATELKQEMFIEKREIEIESELRKKMCDIEIKELLVNQYNPWSWETALDTILLRLKNDQRSEEDFLIDFFEEVDTDDSGNIDIDELFNVLVKAGMRITKEGLNAIITQVDGGTDGDGGDREISREEWNSAVSHYLESKTGNRTHFQSFLKTSREGPGVHPSLNVEDRV